MRRAVLATLVCAVPLLAAPAQASTSIEDRQALRSALGSSARAARGAPVRLPLPEPPAPARASASGGELAAVARSTGPERVLIGARTHADVPGLAAELRALGAEPETLGLIGALAARVPSGADLVAALRDDPRVAYIERDRTLRIAADPFDALDPSTGINFSWFFDDVRAAQAIAAAGGGSSHIVSVIDTGLDVTHPEFAGRVARHVRRRAPAASDVADAVGHGTFVSGLIAAIDGNGIGGKGVAGNTRLVAVRASLDGASSERTWCARSTSRSRRSGVGRHQHEPGRRRLQPQPGARSRGRVLRRRPAGGRLREHAPRPATRSSSPRRRSAA